MLKKIKIFEAGCDVIVLVVEFIAILLSIRKTVFNCKFNDKRSVNQ